MASVTNDLTKQLETLNRMWMESYLKRDVAFLERHLAHEYVSTFPDGTVLSKQEEIAALASGAVILSEMRPSEMRVQLYGEAAIITGRSTIKATVQGREESGQYRFTDVWVKQADRWVAAASQVTRITAQ